MESYLPFSEMDIYRVVAVCRWLIYCVLFVCSPYLDSRSDKEYIFGIRDEVFLRNGTLVVL